MFISLSLLFIYLAVSSEFPQCLFLPLHTPIAQSCSHWVTECLSIYLFLKVENCLLLPFGISVLGAWRELNKRLKIVLNLPHCLRRSVNWRGCLPRPEHELGGWREWRWKCAVHKRIQMRLWVLLNMETPEKKPASSTAKRPRVTESATTSLQRGRGQAQVSWTSSMTPPLSLPLNSDHPSPPTP